MSDDKAEKPDEKPSPRAKAKKDDDVEDEPKAALEHSESTIPASEDQPFRTLTDAQLEELKDREDSKDDEK